MQPNEGGAALAEERAVVWLRCSGAAERNNARLLKRDRFADGFFELLVLDSAKRRLAKLRENFWNGCASCVRNELVEVHILPPNLAGEEARNGGFAAAHESCETNDAARTSVTLHEWDVSLLDERLCNRESVRSNLSGQTGKSGMQRERISRASGC